MHVCACHVLVGTCRSANHVFVSCACMQVFTPLVLKCKQLGRAMRIGTNHGSLSARILSFYGDTPR